MSALVRMVFLKNSAGLRIHQDGSVDNSVSCARLSEHRDEKDQPSSKPPRALR